MAALRNFWGKAVQSSYEPIHTKVIVMPEIEWINTVEAAKILGYKSTQAVRYLMTKMERIGKPLRTFNAGSEEQPRWMLDKKEIAALAKEKGLL